MKEMTHTTMQPSCKLHSSVVEQLYKIIEKNLAAIDATPTLPHSSSSSKKRGHPTKENIQSIIYKTKNYYRNLYQDTIDFHIFLNHTINTEREKNALALAYATFGELIIVQLERLWPRYWNAQYEYFLNALIYFSKALSLDTG